MDGYFHLWHNSGFTELKEELASQPPLDSLATEEERTKTKKGFAALAWVIDLDYEAEIELLVHIKGREEYL